VASFLSRRICSLIEMPITFVSFMNIKEVYMFTKIFVVFYSLYSHVYQLAEAVVEGTKKVKETEVNLIQVPELMPEEVLEKSGAKETR